jgi:hypothetical protein
VIVCLCTWTRLRPRHCSTARACTRPDLFAYFPEYGRVYTYCGTLVVEVNISGNTTPNARLLVCELSKQTGRSHRLVRISRTGSICVGLPEDSARNYHLVTVSHVCFTRCFVCISACKCACPCVNRWRLGPPRPGPPTDGALSLTHVTTRYSLLFEVTENSAPDDLQKVSKWPRENPSWLLEPVPWRLYKCS